VGDRVPRGELRALERREAVASDMGEDQWFLKGREKSWLRNAERTKVIKFPDASKRGTVLEMR
jgi:hypothetical protein